MAIKDQALLDQLDRKYLQSVSFGHFLRSRCYQTRWFWIIVVLLELDLALFIGKYIDTLSTGLHTIIGSFLGLGVGPLVSPPPGILFLAYLSGLVGHITFGMVIYVIVQAVQDRETELAKPLDGSGGNT